MKALITGASSGIGRDMARELALRGCDLILVARREDRLKELQQELATNVRIVPLDLSKKENCYQLYESTKDEDIDFLINNAGFGQFGHFVEMDEESMLSMIDTNIMSLTLLCRLYGEDFVRKDKGRILNVASAAAFTVGPLMSEYYATKAYVYRLTLGMHEELRKNKSKVKVSCLCPGPVRTEFNDVANVHFKFKGQSSEYVARFAIKKALKGKVILIPSKSIAIGKFFSRFVSDRMLAKIGYHFQKSKE